MTRVLDLILSMIALVILAPVALVISIVVWIDSPGSAIYRQERVGRHNVPFRLYKFRSMYVNSDRHGSLTIGDKEPRVTRVGRLLRRTKLDEIPQIVNVIRGDMSIVGPRPEVKKFVDMYTPEERKILNVRPGITDIASIRFRHESELLAKQINPEQFYVQEIMPQKLRLNLVYIENPTVSQYLKIILLTLRQLFHTTD